jgi:transcriptional regulator with XRE-family HTH domain
MSFLKNILDSARESADHQRARILAKNDYKLRRDLVQARRDAGLTQPEVAERMGISQQAVSKLERYDSDPKLSTLRRYAHAVEAVVDHKVTPQAGQVIWQGAVPQFILADSGVTLRTATYIASKRTDFALAG